MDKIIDMAYLNLKIVKKMHGWLASAILRRAGCSLRFKVHPHGSLGRLGHAAVHLNKAVDVQELLLVAYFLRR